MKEGSRNGASLSEGALKGIWREGSSTDDPERYAR